MEPKLFQSTEPNAHWLTNNDSQTFFAKRIARFAMYSIINFVLDHLV